MLKMCLYINGQDIHRVSLHELLISLVLRFPSLSIYPVLGTFEKKTNIDVIVLVSYINCLLRIVTINENISFKTQSGLVVGVQV